MAGGYCLTFMVSLLFVWRRVRGEVRSNVDATFIAAQEFADVRRRLARSYRSVRGSCSGWFHASQACKGAFGDDGLVDHKVLLRGHPLVFVLIPTAGDVVALLVTQEADVVLIGAHLEAVSHAFGVSLVRSLLGCPGDSRLCSSL